MFDLETHIVHMRDTKNSNECFFISAELGVRCADTLQGALPLLDPSRQMPGHLCSFNGPDGKPFAYILSREMWELTRYDLKAGERELFYKHGGVPPESLKEFRGFLEHWDYDYSYSGAVSCPVCQNSTTDWRTDPLHPFLLSNANQGGLLVFQCTHCGTTIRQKHFKDEVVCEHTLPCRMQKAMPKG